MITAENGREILRVLKRPRNAVLALSAALPSFVFFSIQRNLGLIASYLVSEPATGVSLAFSMMTGFPGVVAPYTYAVYVVLAVLIGVNLALMVESLSIKSAMSAPGAFLSVLFAGCSSCGAGALSIAGFSVGLAFLPFGGVEVLYLSALLMAGSSFYLVDRAGACKVSLE